MTDSKRLMRHEQYLTPTTAALTTACVITGLSTYIFTGHSTWLQWSVLFHLFTGIACSLMITPYLYLHFRRTVGFRRGSVLISGLFTILLFLGFVGSGWQMMLHGQQENQRWVYDIHVVTSLVFIAIVVLHLVLHIKLLPKRRRERQEFHFPSLPTNTLRHLVIVNFAVQVLILVAALIYTFTLIPYSETAAVATYQYDYGQQPFRPSQTETFNKTFIDKRQIANSHRCLACHRDVGEQWLSSVHQQAASDPTYVTNVSLLAEKKGISATRYCEGCHAPVALLSGELSPGGQHGGIAGTVSNVEGVSCMACHGINSLVNLKGVASFEFKPRADYLFARSENPLLLRLHDLLVQVKPDQHKRDLGKPLFKEAKFCSTCHTQFIDKELNDWGWIKMQDEYAAWLKSPYSKQHEEGFSNTTGSRCQDCHMPLMDSDDPSADRNGKIRSHHFPGANTFLPLLKGDEKQLAATKTFLQSNKLRISIDKPNRKDALQTLHALDEKLRNFEEAPYYYYLGEEAKITIVVSNRGVGHDFPGGTIDINESWIEFLVMDAEGQPVFSSGSIDRDNNVDDQAYFYRSLPIDRSGNLVWQHDLFNMVGEAFKRVIKAGESDIVDYTFVVPSWVKSPLTVTATLKYRKLNERYARWALKDQYVEIPVVDMAWDSLSIPIKIRKEVK